MERMSEEEFINNVEWHITSLKNLDNKALKILVGKLEEENKKLKAELDKYKKQYQHSMWFMEEDTLQELKDIGEI